MTVKVGMVTLDPELADTLRQEIATRHKAISFRSVREAVNAEVGLVFAQWIEGDQSSDLLQGLKLATTRQIPIPVVVLIPEGSLEAVYRAREAGAADVLFCPPEPEEIAAEIDDMEMASESHGIVDRETFRRIAEEDLVGDSPAFRRCLGDLRLTAVSDANVLLLGETGTGKEMFARAIHHLGRRCGNPYVAVNCASLSPQLLESELFGHKKGAFTDAIAANVGRFELAGAGTLLLDEIGDIDVSFQMKLLRVIEQRSFQRVGEGKDVPFFARLICTTSVDIDRATREGRFRPDLLGRINQVRITLPPLRERRMDVSLLARRFVVKHGRGRSISISRTAFEVLEAFDFPMNVRQLENAIVAAITRLGDGSTILPKHLPRELTSAREERPATATYTIRIPKNLEYDKARELAQQEIDRLHLTALLEKHDGKQSRAAQEAGIDRKTLVSRLRASRAASEKEGGDG